MKQYEAGLLGELKAARYLKKRGMRILTHRYRTKHGEIDLIARDGTVTVFVEVKYRPRGEPGEGLQAVGSEKRRHLRYAAQQYLLSHPCTDVRFDVVEISAAGIHHIPCAF